MRALPLPFVCLGDSAAERNSDSVIYWKSRSAPTTKNSPFLQSLILSFIAFLADIKSSSVAAILEACLNSHLSADVAELCALLLCKFSPNYKVCTHREASLCLSPVPSGLCLSVCEVGGFMWPPCCCSVLVHVGWAESHVGWVGCCEPQPLSSAAFPCKGGAQCGSAPSRINSSLSWCWTALQTWILPVWVLLGGQLKYLSSYFVFCAPVSLYLLCPSSSSIHCSLFTVVPLQSSLWQFTWADLLLLSVIVSSYHVTQMVLNQLRTKK